MKKLIALMEALKSEIDDMVINRQDTFEDRTEKWQESEKGEEYAERTDLLEEMTGTLEEWIEELSE